MKRSNAGWWVPLALLGLVGYGGGGLTSLFAQDMKKDVLKQDAQRDAMFKSELERIQNDTTLTPEQRTQKYDETYARWFQGKQKTGSLVSEMDRTAATIENQKRTADMYRRPGFWDGVGNMAVNVAGEMLKEAIKNWMNNPNAENLRKMEELTRERDRLMNERNNPQPGGDGGFGRPVYDGSGNIVGWDRDGDGRPDMTDGNNDGTPDTFNGGTNESAYADPYEYLDSPTASNSGGSGAGTPIYDNGSLVGYDTNGDGVMDVAAAPVDGVGGGTGGGGGGEAGGGGGSSGLGGGEGEEGEGKEDEEGEGEELAAADDEEGTRTGDRGGKPRDRDRDGKDDATGQELVMMTGRIIVMQKGGEAMPGGPGAAGNRVPTAPVEDDWNDAEDNGDREDDWGEDWGEDWGTESAEPGPAQPTLPGARPGAPGAAPGGRMPPASAETKLVDQLIRVETVIAEWRKKAKEEAGNQTDPYGFQDNRHQGYEDATRPAEDPLAHLRGADGKLDLTRCEIWVVERDSWMEGKEPRRFQIAVGEDAIDDFEPINFGYVVVRGVISDVTVEPRVLAEIKGEVKKFEIVQVMLCTEETPESIANPAAPGAAPGTPAAPLEDDDWK